MLNPYVPNLAGSVSATRKKATTGDPLNDMSYNDGNSRGPMPDDAILNVAGMKPPLQVLPPSGFGNPVQPPQVNRPPVFSASVAANTGGINSGTNAMPDAPQFQFAEDRLNDMLASNSTFMTRARREGTNAAANRGGLNSSIAGGFAMGAAIDRAAPIAGADARFTQEDYTLGRRAILDDLAAGNNATRNDNLNANENVRSMGRINLESDLADQRDANNSVRRQNEDRYSTTLRDALENNNTQRNAWLNQQSDLSRAYTNSLTMSANTNMGFIASLGQAFIDDPEVFSPQVVTGMSEFFQGLTSGVGSSAISQIIRDIQGTGGAATQPVMPTTPTPPVGG